MDRTCLATCGVPDLCNEALAMYEGAVAQSADGGDLALDEVPACLHKLGLVVPSAQAPDRVRAVPPSVAAAHHLAPLERAISRTRTELAAATETFALIEQAYNRGLRDTCRMSCPSGARRRLRPRCSARSTSAGWNSSPYTRGKGVPRRSWRTCSTVPSPRCVGASTRE